MGAVILQMVQQNDEKHEAGHKRLRSDYRELENDVETLTKKLADMDRLLEKLSQAQTAPVDVGQIVFNPRMVLAIVGLVVSILGGTWFINQPIMSRLDKFEERMSSQRDVIDGLTKAMEMRRLEIQNVSNSLQQYQQQRTGR